MAFEEQPRRHGGTSGRVPHGRLCDNFLTVRAIGEKVLDGALGTHGGWLLEPYTDLPRSSGLNVVPVAEIEASARLGCRHDYQMAIQGIGDRALSRTARHLRERVRTHPEKTDCAGASSTPR